jgi:uncharacterized protein with LGFP repeats
MARLPGKAAHRVSRHPVATRQRREQPQPQSCDQHRADAAHYHRSDRAEQRGVGAGLEFAQLVGRADEDRIDCRATPNITDTPKIS